MRTSLERGAGLLMPISSLPSPFGIGTLGAAAYEFVDWLKRARQKYWQVLPVGPVSYTHLDVYKRQTSRGWGPSGAVAVSPASVCPVYPAGPA